MTKHRSIYCSLLLAAVMACAGIQYAASAAPPAYHVTDLGTLGGNRSIAYRVNESGQVSGTSNSAAADTLHAFLWTPKKPNGTRGVMTNLFTSEQEYTSSGEGINDSGQVIGFVWPTSSSFLESFLWTPTTPNGDSGTIQSLGSLAGTFSYAYDINNSGQVTGGFYTTGSAARAFIYDGALQDLGTLGGTYSSGFRINNGGQVTGSSKTTGDASENPFLWTPTTPNGSSGSMIDLGSFGGTLNGGVALNDHGRVVGYSSLPGDAFYHAFLYDGALHDLGTLGGAFSSGEGINGSDQVVGWSHTLSAQHAFIYTSDRGMVDLNSLIDPLLGWELIGATSINDIGQITGHGVVAGEQRAFLLTPIPEPGALMLMVLGLPLLLQGRRRKRSESEPAHRPLRMEHLEDRNLLATFAVSNLNDAGAGSLRQAIANANSLAGEDTISFASVAGTIALTSGEIEITEALTINGPGSEAITIDAQHNSRILNITALTGDIAVNGLKLIGGKTTGTNVEYYDNSFFGGAIRSVTEGSLTITNSIVSGSQTTGDRAAGGAIFAYGNLAINYSTVSGNTTTGYRATGGGLYAYGNVTINHSTVSGNSTTGYGAVGGGVNAYGNVTLTNSTLSGNSTAGMYSPGGGLHAYGNVTLTDSTLSSNHTEGEGALGGGINAFGDVAIVNSVLSSNFTEGVGASGGAIASQGDVSVANSSVLENYTLADSAVGGAIFNFGDVSLSVSLVSGNHTEGEASSGGGIRANSNVSLVNSTVSGNYTTGYGATGGGVWAYESVTLTNSTIGGNYTEGDYGWGAGCFSPGDLTLINSTISGNHSAGVFANGAGAYLGQYGTLTLSNSILAGNSAIDGRPDIWMVGSVLPVLHYSLIGNNFGAALLIPAPLGSPDANGNLIGTPEDPIDPVLGPLADNGGLTLPDGSKILTMAPAPGSPVIDKGDPLFAFNPAQFDERGIGYVRVYNGDGVGTARIDMGAIELQPIIPAPELPGDYNHDHAVNALDYTVWRNMLGVAGLTPYSAADGNGNGSIGEEDFVVWKKHYGDTSPPGGGGLATTSVETQVLHDPLPKTLGVSFVDLALENTSTSNSRSKAAGVDAAKLRTAAGGSAPLARALLILGCQRDHLTEAGKHEVTTFSDPSDRDADCADEFFTNLGVARLHNPF